MKTVFLLRSTGVIGGPVPPGSAAYGNHPQQGGVAPTKGTYLHGLVTVCPGMPRIVLEYEAISYM